MQTTASFIFPDSAAATATSGAHFHELLTVSGHVAVFTKPTNMLAVIPSLVATSGYAQTQS